jgi:hypothetical protein
MLRTRAALVRQRCVLKLISSSKNSINGALIRNKRFVSSEKEGRRNLAVAAEAKSLDEIYTRKSPIEHILLRPGMYIGGIETESTQLWIPNHDFTKFIQKKVTYSPGTICPQSIFYCYSVSTVANERLLCVASAFF